MLCSLLVKAVFLFVEVSFCETGAIYCGISCSHEYLACGCGGLLCHSCIVGSHPHKARKCSRTGCQSSPAVLLEAFWIFFSFVIDYSFPPFFHVQLSRPWDTLKQTLGSSHVTEVCNIIARCLNKTCSNSIDNPRSSITRCYGIQVYTLTLYPEAVLWLHASRCG